MKEIRKLIHRENDPYANLGSEFRELDLQGWGSNSEIFKKYFDIVNPKLVIEVGSWKGASAIHMAKTLREKYDDFEIVCVDTWLGSVEHWEGTGDFIDRQQHGRATIYYQFLSNVIHEGLTDYITPFPIDSLNAAEFFKRKNIKPDIVYIDAGHEYTSVKCDLYEYSQVLREGGYMIGDDWHHEPIKRAAIELFTDNDASPEKVIEETDNKFVWIK
jgi:SAM-dependent methyltransferase